MCCILGQFKRPHQDSHRPPKSNNFTMKESFITWSTTGDLTYGATCVFLESLECFYAIEQFVSSNRSYGVENGSNLFRYIFIYNFVDTP